MCLGWLRRTNGKPHCPQMSPRPNAFCAFAGVHTSSHWKCPRLLCVIIPEPWSTPSLIHTPAGRQAEGFCRVLYSCFLIVRIHPMTHSHGAERTDFSEGQILAIVGNHTIHPRPRASWSVIMIVFLGRQRNRRTKKQRESFRIVLSKSLPICSQVLHKGS